MKFPDILGIFKKKEAVVEPVAENATAPLPKDLEKFRMQRQTVEERYAPLPERPMPREEPAPAEKYASGDRIDMILQKLETIDTRLKLIEERMRR